MDQPDHRKRRPSLAVALMWRLSAGVLAVGVLLAFVDWRVRARQLERDLLDEANRTCDVYARALTPFLWTLDSEAVADYFDRAPLPRDLASVRVLTQFGDPVWSRHFLPGASDLLIHSCPVLLQGETIGRIDVSFSRQGLHQARARLIRRTAVRTVVAISAVILLTGLCVNLFLRRPLQTLVAGLRKLAEGRYEERLPPVRYAELDEVSREANTMAERIAAHTRELEAEVVERRAAEQQLRDHQSRLEGLVQERTAALTVTNRELQAEVAARRRAQTETLRISHWEQRRIGQDLHDNVGQLLTGACLYAEALAEELRTSVPAAAAKAGKIGEVLHQALVQVRLTTRGLNPRDLRGPGLLFTLRQLVQDTRMLSAVECELVVDGNWSHLDESTATHLYRLAQEAVANALRHAHGSAITLRIEEIDADTGTLSIHDNGRGLAPDFEAHAGIGLRTMRARAEALRGTFHIGAGPDGGTVVRCTFPLAHGDEPADGWPVGE